MRNTGYPASRSALLLASAVALFAGCDVAEEAANLTFGEGNIKRIKMEVAWPDANELSALDPDDVEGVTGFPETFEQGTLAHLMGGLAATGECQKLSRFDELAGSNQVTGVTMRVAACTDDDRCSQWCDEGFYGMTIEMRVEMVLVDEQQIAKLKEPLGDAKPDVLKQIRLRFFELELFQEGKDGREITTNFFEGFEFAVGNDIGDEVVIIERRHLDAITPETPQRFDVDSTSEFTRSLKEQIIGGAATSINLIQRMRVPQENLYDLTLDGAGVIVDLQPEIVISALDVAKARF